jgi:hypothetical protein
MNNWSLFWRAITFSFKWLFLNSLCLVIITFIICETEFLKRLDLNLNIWKVTGEFLINRANILIIIAPLTTSALVDYIIGENLRLTKFEEFTTYFCLAIIFTVTGIIYSERYHDLPFYFSGGPHPVIWIFAIILFFSLILKTIASFKIKV